VLANSGCGVTVMLTAHRVGLLSYCCVLPVRDPAIGGQPIGPAFKGRILNP